MSKIKDIQKLPLRITGGAHSTQFEGQEKKLLLDVFKANRPSMPVGATKNPSTEDLALATHNSYR